MSIIGASNNKSIKMVDYYGFTSKQCKKGKWSGYLFVHSNQQNPSSLVFIRSKD